MEGLAAIALIAAVSSVVLANNPVNVRDNILYISPYY